MKLFAIKIGRKYFKDFKYSHNGNKGCYSWGTGLGGRNEGMIGVITEPLTQRVLTTSRSIGNNLNDITYLMKTGKIKQKRLVIEMYEEKEVVECLKQL